MNIYFLFMAELNKVRERARIRARTNPTPGQMIKLDSQPVLFLSSNFPKLWSVYHGQNREAEMEKLVEQISMYKNVLMLYFPQMEVTQTPDFENSQTTPSEEEGYEGGVN